MQIVINFLQNGKDLDEDKDRKQIKEDMNRLFAQLDFLTYDTVVNQKEVFTLLEYVRNVKSFFTKKAIQVSIEV